MMTFPTIAAGTRANEAIGGYANFVAYCNALAAGVDSVTTTAAGAALKANNLSDLASASTARTNLGLGTAAVADTGTGAANVILGNDSRLTDTRTPTAASIVDAMIATTLSPSKITGTAAILGANTFTAQQFIDGSSDQIQLRVQGVAGQSVNTVTVENSAGSVVASISAAGKGTFAGVTSTAGTFTSSVPALSVTGTMPTTGGTFVYGSDHVITSAGSAAHSQIALHSNLAAGYTGNRYTMAAYIENNTAGTGTSAWGANYANYGALSQVTATTTGHNVGQLGYASGGVLNIGFMGQAPSNKNSGVNVGVVGFGLNGGTSPTQVGGYFALTNGAAAPTLTSAALMADNVAQTSDIFVARDNGVNVFTVADGGALGFFGGAPVAKPTGVAVSAAAIHAALVTLNLIAA